MPTIKDILSKSTLSEMAKEENVSLNQLNYLSLVKRSGTKTVANFI